MHYEKTVILKNGAACLLRHMEAADGAAMLDVFIRTHEQTDYLLSYADEITLTAEEEADYLQKKADSDREIEIGAFVDGKLVGSAGVSAASKAFKLRHRAEFGIAIDRPYWCLGIGSALTAACIECARAAGYRQLELAVIEGNDSAYALYRKHGFVEYGCNPRDSLTREGKWQAAIAMRLELDRGIPYETL